MTAAVLAVGEGIETDVLAALHTVTDPELDEPITDLGFVRAVRIDDTGVEVHLRLPTAFCSPNFAYLMASDALDALRTVEHVGQARVWLDDHHDSDKINAGLAADAGYLGTFGVEAQTSLDELRRTFLGKAHIAAMERCVAAVMRARQLDASTIASLTLRDLPDDKNRQALVRRRLDIGLSLCPNSRVLVGDDGRALEPDAVPLRLRFARTVRVSMEGNAHFCRGLLATRYDDGATAAHITNTRTRNPR